MARPKKSGKREPNGRLSRQVPDHGTPEVQARRRWFAGKGDQNLTSFPLGILRANNQITKTEFENGCKFAWLYSIVFGRAHLGAKGSGIRDLADNPEWLSARQRELNTALEVLENVSLRLRNVMLDICVFERMPRWLGPIVPTLEDFHDALPPEEGHVLAGQRQAAADIQTDGARAGDDDPARRIGHETPFRVSKSKQDDTADCFGRPP